MVKRFIIIGVIFGLLIGGLAFFQFVFLPQMIRQAILGAPPPVERFRRKLRRSSIGRRS
jgi:hypothetical protein